eukprot:TRINITY_DN11401_c0_g1_i1.p1 TRINITY_DN11401_c0_g1~~TRINITY_DN11401_c0_g1_i1.p1  ORF type:complete len:488 (+),score=105.00 TRINITY_DN11401_c0_g1_i1:186-1466(+)
MESPRKAMESPRKAMESPRIAMESHQKITEVPHKSVESLKTTESHQRNSGRSLESYPRRNSKSRQMPEPRNEDHCKFSESSVKIKVSSQDRTEFGPNNESSHNTEISGRSLDIQLKSTSASESLRRNSKSGRNMGPKKPVWDIQSHLLESGKISLESLQVTPEVPGPKAPLQLVEQSEKICSFRNILKDDPKIGEMKSRTLSIVDTIERNVRRKEFTEAALTALEDVIDEILDYFWEHGKKFSSDASCKRLIEFLDGFDQASANFIDLVIDCSLEKNDIELILVEMEEKLFIFEKYLFQLCHLDFYGDSEEADEDDDSCEGIVDLAVSQIPFNRTNLSSHSQVQQLPHTETTQLGRSTFQSESEPRTQEPETETETEPEPEPEPEPELNAESQTQAPLQPAKGLQSSQLTTSRATTTQKQKKKKNT